MSKLFEPAQGEKYISVPWKYRVKLRRTQHIPNDERDLSTRASNKTKASNEIAFIHGEVHPVPYSHVGGRLHNDHGPAMLMRDGWPVYAVHGVRVPSWVIEHPDKITPDMIVSEANTEVRRIMIERYGWDRFVSDARLCLIDEQDDPANPGHSLKLYDLPEGLLKARVRLLVCTNASPEGDGTRRVFGLTVDRHHHDAVAAAASTFRLSADDYRQLARAT